MSRHGSYRHPRTLEEIQKNYEGVIEEMSYSIPHVKSEYSVLRRKRICSAGALSPAPPRPTAKGRRYGFEKVRFLVWFAIDKTAARKYSKET